MSLLLGKLTGCQPSGLFSLTHRQLARRFLSLLLSVQTSCFFSLTLCKLTSCFFGLALGQLARGLFGFALSLLTCSFMQLGYHRQQLMDEIVQMPGAFVGNELIQDFSEFWRYADRRPQTIEFLRSQVAAVRCIAWRQRCELYGPQPPSDVFVSCGDLNL